MSSIFLRRAFFHRLSVHNTTAAVLLGTLIPALLTPMTRYPFQRGGATIAEFRRVFILLRFRARALAAAYLVYLFKVDHTFGVLFGELTEAIKELSYVACHLSVQLVFDSVYLSQDRICLHLSFSQ